LGSGQIGSALVSLATSCSEKSGGGEAFFPGRDERQWVSCRSPELYRLASGCVSVVKATHLLFVFAARFPNKAHPQSEKTPSRKLGSPRRYLPRSDTANRPGPQTMPACRFNKSTAPSQQKPSPRRLLLHDAFYRVRPDVLLHGSMRLVWRGFIRARRVANTRCAEITRARKVLPQVNLLQVLVL